MSILIEQLDPHLALSQPVYGYLRSANLSGFLISYVRRIVELYSYRVQKKYSNPIQDSV